MLYYITLNLIVCLQDEDLIRYHILIDEKLLKNEMHNGMHRETMLGYSYHVGFFLHNSQVLLSTILQFHALQAAKKIAADDSSIPSTQMECLSDL